MFTAKSLPGERENKKSNITSDGFEAASFVASKQCILKLPREMIWLARKLRQEDEGRYGYYHTGALSPTALCSIERGNELVCVEMETFSAKRVKKNNVDFSTHIVYSFKYLSCQSTFNVILPSYDWRAAMWLRR